MNQKLAFWSIVFALGGLLLVNSSVIPKNEHEIQKVRNPIDELHVQAIVSPFYDTIICALFSDVSAVKFGQKKFLIWIGILFLISTISAGVAAEDVSMVFRFLGGMCVWASSILALIFITNIAPTKTRGKLIATFQFTIVFGILFVYFSNYFLSTVGEDALGLKLGILAIPALVFVALMFFVTRSLRCLMGSGNDDITFINNHVKWYFHPRYKVTVADTIGSGNSFLDAFLLSIIQGRSPEVALNFTNGLAPWLLPKKILRLIVPQRN